MFQQINGHTNINDSIVNIWSASLSSVENVWKFFSKASTNPTANNSIKNTSTNDNWSQKQFWFDRSADVQTTFQILNKASIKLQKIFNKMISLNFRCKEEFVSGKETILQTTKKEKKKTENTRTKDRRFSEKQSLIIFIVLKDW